MNFWFLAPPLAPFAMEPEKSFPEFPDIPVDPFPTMDYTYDPIEGSAADEVPNNDDEDDLAFMRRRKSTKSVVISTRL